AWVLHASTEHSVNVEGAFQHVMADLYGSVGVVVSGILIRTLGWNISDPILSVVLSLLIFYNSLGLVRKVFHVLMEGTPHHLDVYKLCHDIESLEGVTVIHDVHAWSISADEELLTAHVLIDPDWTGDVQELLEEVRRIAYEDHELTHVTIQLETSTRNCKERHHVGHLEAKSRVRS
ncbi:MAG: cation diffusion facilitator family transporter, partial [bacterium]|nr:cation diffusion facilitator family transporter [bacterium]